MIYCKTLDRIFMLTTSAVKGGHLITNFHDQGPTRTATIKSNRTVKELKLIADTNQGMEIRRVGKVGLPSLKIFLADHRPAASEVEQQEKRRADRSSACEYLLLFFVPTSNAQFADETSN